MVPAPLAGKSLCKVAEELVVVFPLRMGWLERVDKSCDVEVLPPAWTPRLNGHEAHFSSTSFVCRVSVDLLSFPFLKKNEDSLCLLVPLFPPSFFFCLDSRCVPLGKHVSFLSEVVFFVLSEGT